MNFQEYLNIKAINASFLKACMQGDQQGYDSLHNLQTFSPASQVAMNLGSAAHSYILEPHLFDSEWAVSPKFDGRTTEGKNSKKLFEESSAGKKIINFDEFDLIKKFSDKCQNNPYIKIALDKFEKEKTYQFSIDGIEMKARLDIVGESDDQIADLKTTRDASPKAFTTDLINMGYDIQMYHYAQPLMLKYDRKPEVFVICLETTSGEVALYNINHIVYSDFTKHRYYMAIQTALRVKKMKERPLKYTKQIVALDLPYWAK